MLENKSCITLQKYSGKDKSKELENDIVINKEI